MGLTETILALLAAFAAHSSPAGNIKHEECHPAGWRSMFNQPELEKCEESNSTADCTLLVDPDDDYLKARCRGNFPYAYEVRAGDEKDPRPELLIFCTRKEYDDATERGSIRDYTYLEHIFQMAGDRHQ
ncbi:hypothetical protein JW898_01740 [Candidatus Woesearchaeota archaeon]|nr:hypothetical protein [Candidatus Woesearchaeota archaeon]